MAGCCGGNGGSTVTSEDVHAQVAKRYGAAARRVLAGGEAECGSAESRMARELYAAEEVAELPPSAFAASLGCGNPTALAELREGEVVLDLGSGGGIDVLLSARRVGERGKVYGLDMSEEMLALARSNQREAGLSNVEFLKGRIEEIPLPAESVDTIISNCVVNLSPDKERVLREAYRVLRPGGRLAISDVVFLQEPPAEIREAFDLWSACVSGALLVEEYRRMLTEAGFERGDIEVTRVYGSELLDLLPDLATNDREARGVLGAAFVRAWKPLEGGGMQAA